MKDNRNDKTIERNYVQKWRFLIAEYQLVKAKKHPKFRFVQDFHPSTASAARPSELGLYLLYYNTAHPHQGLGGKTPLQAL